MVVDLRSSCVAQYKLDQNEPSTLVVDSRDNYNAVASRNTNNLFDANGKIGGCFNFAGVDYVLVPSAINGVFKSSFSINFWLNAPEHIETATFCGVDNGTSSFLLWPEGQGLYVAYNTGPGSSLDMYNAAALAYNTWQMITVTMEQINPTTVEGRLYVNGQLVADPVQHTIVMSDWTAEIPFGIGAENHTDIFPTFGKIDNFCVFDTVLTVDDIAFLYNGGEGTEDFAEYGMIGPPVVTDITTDTDSLTVSLTGDTSATHTVLYRLSTATEWTTGGTRTGNGNVTISGLSAGTYYVIAYSTLSGVNSTPGNLVPTSIQAVGVVLKEAIMAVLIDDARLDFGTSLGKLLGKHQQIPYGIYFVSPPVKPDIPFITYQFLGETDRWVDEIILNITIYSNDFDTICKRIKKLLNGKQISSLSDCRFLMCKWDWCGPDLWDDNLKVYYKNSRYIIKIKR